MAHSYELIGRRLAYISSHREVRSGSSLSPSDSVSMKREVQKNIRWHQHEIDEVEKALEPHQDFSDFVRNAAVEKAIEDNKE